MRLNRPLTRLNMRDSVVDKSCSLKSAFILSLSLSLALAPVWGFELKPDTDDTDYPTYTDSVITSDDDAADGDSILIEGSPTGTGNAALLIDDDSAVTLDGMIRIRDYDDDNVNTPITDAIGLDIDFDVTDAAGIRLKSGGDIFIIEIRGPEYDGDDDGFADNDSDEDGIGEGSPALAGNHTRIGLRLQSGHSLTGPLIGESGSQIDIEGNAAAIGDVAGVKIDGDLINNLDLSTLIGVRGDKGRGVDINGTIVGYYRQRGDIDVRGENSVAIDIGADITGSLMIEGLANATGYSTAPVPGRGIDESDLTNEQRAANNNERRRGGSAVNIDAGVDGGLIVGGVINRVVSEDERDEINAINERRSDSDNDNDNVVALKTDPYHFDENRSSGRITTYGEADGEASLKITGSIGSVGGATREVLLDTRDDDDDDTAASEDDAADFYDSTGEFFFSHGLINRGSIEANGWYDDVKADAVLLDGATIHGGLFNSGTISATAYNEDARALIIGTGAELNDGLRSDNAVLLNEGTISAFVGTHTGSSDFDETETYQATAITLQNGVTLPDGAVFINRSSVSANAAHTKAETSDADEDNVAIAFDFSTYNGNVDITQELLKADTTLAANVDGNAGDETVYRGSGDTDIDRAGATNSDDEIVGDGVIDTRDVAAPSIIGDVNFGDGANVFEIRAGTVNGNINFNDGNDTLNLSNEIQDDADDDYTAPITTVTGRIIKSVGNLDISIGERSRLYLIGQEGDADTETENLDINTMTINGELQLSIDADQLSEDTALLNVATLTLNPGAKITPSLTRLYEDGKTVKLIDYGNSPNLPADFLNNDDTPFVYNVALDNSDNAISASFVTKTAAQTGLTNPTELAAYNAVLAHFSGNEDLETALTGIDNEADFKAAYRQLFPHYSDGTAQQLSGLADMATGAVSQHLQLINAGGRRGGDGWLQQFGDYRKQDASANGATVSGTSYAIALGYDLPVSIIDALGLYLQMGFTAVNEKSAVANEVTSESITYGIYLSDKIGALQYEVNAAYGFVDLESFRLIDFAGLVERMSASWDATSTAASARLAYPILQDNHLLRLEAGMDYFNLAHDDFSEVETVGYDFAMQVKGGESEKTSQFIGLRGGYRRGGDDPVAIVWEPNYYLGWRSTSEFTPYEASANFIGSDESFTMQSHIEPEDAIDIGLGLAAHNDYFAFEFNYRARIADDEETHGGGVSIRLLF
ncbi:MAG: Uncharacterised protein [Alphaproteobacteria bacterium]|nr:MAG: Uncharacterised protein [Alphaproteobacteria bacterium]